MSVTMSVTMSVRCKFIRDIPQMFLQHSYCVSIVSIHVHLIFHISATDRPMSARIKLERPESSKSTVVTEKERRKVLPVSNL